MWARVLNGQLLCAVCAAALVVAGCGDGEDASTREKPTVAKGGGDKPATDSPKTDDPAPTDSDDTPPVDTGTTSEPMTDTPEPTDTDTPMADDAGPADTDTSTTDAPSDDAPAETTEASGDWGDLKIRFVYDGSPPSPDAITPTKDIEVCGKHQLVDEEVKVSEDGGLANVVVWIRSDHEVHPDLEAPSGEAVIDNKNCRFEPHIVVYRTGQQLVLKNSDPIGHNTNVAGFFDNTPFNHLIPAGQSIEKQLEFDEALPVKVQCTIHPWMLGHLVVKDTPYAGASATDGTLTISKLPIGEHEFQFWHEAAGFLNLDLGGETAERGRLSIEIKPGMNDMGDVKVKPSLLKR